MPEKCFIWLCFELDMEYGQLRVLERKWTALRGWLHEVEKSQIGGETTCILWPDILSMQNPSALIYSGIDVHQTKVNSSGLTNSIRVAGECGVVESPSKTVATSERRALYSFSLSKIIIYVYMIYTS